MAQCENEVRTCPQTLSVTFPGGATIEAQYVGSGCAPPLELAKTLMGQVSGAMAPLKPIFDIVGAIIAIKDFASSVPEIIVNPGAVVEAIKNLVEKVDALIKLIPQASVPLFILNMLDLIIYYLSGVLEVLQALAAQEARIATARQTAIDLDLAELLEGVLCAEAQLEAQLANLKAGAGPVDSMIGTLNLFVSLVPGVPEIPTLGNLPDSVSEAVDALEGIVSVLQSVRSTIPL